VQGDEGGRCGGDGGKQPGGDWFGCNGRLIAGGRRATGKGVRGRGRARVGRRSVVRWGGCYGKMGCV